MKEETRWKILVALALVTLSLALYTVHFAIFHDAEHILIFLVSDIAFLPIEVLVVTLIIEELLESREKQQRMEKLNLVIGTFFSTEGSPLLSRLAPADPRSAKMHDDLAIKDNWTPDRFEQMHDYLCKNPCSITIDTLDLVRLREFLVSREDFVLRIVENPMVFEHESFTGLLLAISHLTEELKARPDLASLPKTDLVHLERDINRVYGALVCEWLHYMQYIHVQYPYLFSLAIRTNPFDRSASVVIRS